MRRGSDRNPYPVTGGCKIGLQISQRFPARLGVLGFRVGQAADPSGDAGAGPPRRPRKHAASCSRVARPRRRGHPATAAAAGARVPHDAMGKRHPAGDAVLPGGAAPGLCPAALNPGADPCRQRECVAWFAGWRCPASRPRRGATAGLRSPGRREAGAMAWSGGRTPVGRPCVGRPQRLVGQGQTLPTVTRCGRWPCHLAERGQAIASATTEGVPLTSCR